jgi:hypothetical protein
MASPVDDNLPNIDAPDDFCPNPYAAYQNVRIRFVGKIAAK